jgi:chaperonin GroES
VRKGRNADELEIDDRVLYGKYSGTQINIDNVDYLIIRQGDVLGVL